MGILLWLSDDPDWRFPYHEEFAAGKGVRLGHDSPLPRTPAIYEKKTKWHKYDPEVSEGQPEWGRNYVSAAQNVSAVRKQFEEEAALGMMIRLSLDEAKAEWADGLHVAALAASAKSNDSFRILAALALQHLRPFLGPLYAWSSAVPGGACLPLPGAIRLILTFMLKLLASGPALVPCRKVGGEAKLEFRADAKAEGDDIGVGGWCVDP